MFVRIKFNNCLIFIFMMSIFVDIINGWLISQAGLYIPLSQTFKGLLFLFFVFCLFYPRCDLIKVAMFIMFSIVFLSPLLTVRLSGINSESNFSGDIAYLLKVLIFPLAYFGLSNISNTKLFPSQGGMIKLNNVIYYVIFTSLLLSLFGYGETQYGTNSDGVEYGFKGYFLSGNELSSLYVLSYASCLFSSIYYRSRFLGFSLKVLSGLVVAILLATKTALLSFVIVTLSIPICARVYYRKNPDLNVRKLTRSYLRNMIFLTVCLAGFAVSVLSERIYLTIERFEYFYQRHGDSWLGFLLSGREERYSLLSKLYFDNMTLLDKMFGIGREHYVNFFFGSENRFSAEMDLIDSVISHGLFGTILLYSFWIMSVYKIYKSFSSRDYELAVPTLIIVSLLFINSFIAGHVMASSMVCIYLALMLSGMNDKRGSSWSST
jgi:hypothetical protein